MKLHSAASLNVLYRIVYAIQLGIISTKQIHYIAVSSLQDLLLTVLDILICQNEYEYHKIFPLVKLFKPKGMSYVLQYLLIFRSKILLSI